MEGFTAVFTKKSVLDTAKLEAIRDKCRLLLRALESRWNVQYVFIPVAQLPAGAKTIKVKVSPAENSDWFFTVFLVSICAVFFVTRLDAIDHSQQMRQFIISILNWTTAYEPLMDRPWTPVTCMWIHGSFFHLFCNVSGIMLCGYLLEKAYGPRAWRLFCFVGAFVGGAAHCVIEHCPAADFSRWHGQTLVSIFHEPATPLAGASGGAMAMFGAATTAALIYWLKRKNGVANQMGIGFFALSMTALAQFFLFDLGNSGVAGLAHEVSWATGILLGFFLPIYGDPKLLISKPGTVILVKAYCNRASKTLTAAELLIGSEFDPQHDYVGVSQDVINKKTKATFKILFGCYRDGSEKFLLNVNLMRVKLPLAVRQGNIRFAAFSWLVMAGMLAASFGPKGWIIYAFLYGVCQALIDSLIGVASYRLQTDPKA